MDKDAVNKVVAAILAGQAAAVTDSSKHVGTFVDKYFEMLHEIQKREQAIKDEEDAKRSQEWSDLAG